jgi:hypothetical protein
MEVRLSESILEDGSTMRRILYEVAGGGGPETRSYAQLIEGLSSSHPPISQETQAEASEAIEDIVPSQQPRLENENDSIYPHEDDELDETGYNFSPSSGQEDGDSSSSEKSWETIESSESLEEILRSDSRGKVAQNYHHDHLLHQKWPSPSRPNLRRGDCAKCPRRRFQPRPRMSMVEAFAQEGCFYCKMICEIVTYHAPTNPSYSGSGVRHVDWAGGDWYSFGIECESHNGDHPQFGNDSCGVEVFATPGRPLPTYYYQ